MVVRPAGLSLRLARRLGPPSSRAVLPGPAAKSGGHERAQTQARLGGGDRRLGDRHLPCRRARSRGPHRRCVRRHRRLQHLRVRLGGAEPDPATVRRRRHQRRVRAGAHGAARRRRRRARAKAHRHAARLHARRGRRRVRGAHPRGDAGRQDHLSRAHRLQRDGDPRGALPADPRADGARPRARGRPDRRALRARALHHAGRRQHRLEPRDHRLHGGLARRLGRVRARLGHARRARSSS